MPERPLRRLAAAAAMVLAACSAPTAAQPPPSRAPSIAPVASRTVPPEPSERADAPAASPSPSPTPAIDVDVVDAPWARRLDEVATGRRVSIAVGIGDRILYEHLGSVRRIPASGQKLLTSYAALEAFGPAHRFRTTASSVRHSANGVVRGDLWLIGGGDPELGAPRIAVLADTLVERGLRRVTGSVIGDVSAFSRRWWAPGWVDGISRSYVTRPTALTYDGNTVAAPELSAARALTAALVVRGVQVAGAARTGTAPDRTRPIAHVGSAPLRELLARQNHSSLNLHAEILLRALGADAGHPTTSGGAGLVTDAIASEALTVRVRDGSGLSHGNAVSAVDLTSVLLLAAGEPWGPAFEASLPPGGAGTLRGRLVGVPVRAKTGTLFTVPCSALAGYVRDATGRRVAFAVLSDGIPKGSSIAIEDAVVRILSSARIG